MRHSTDSSNNLYDQHRFKLLYGYLIAYLHMRCITFSKMHLSVQSLSRFLLNFHCITVFIEYVVHTSILYEFFVNLFTLIVRVCTRTFIIYTSLRKRGKNSVACNLYLPSVTYYTLILSRF